RGTIELEGRLVDASNTTLRAVITRHGVEARCVYKPVAGERPLWDFPDGTLAGREYAAYLTSEATGWNLVPPTVLRDGPFGIGSVQRFVRFDLDEHSFTLLERFPDEFRRIATFDLVVNNADRKAGHCLLGEDGRIHAIDHGLCFSTEPKLRTVLWDFAGEPIPEALRPDLTRLADGVRSGPLRGELSALLDDAELEALAGRAAATAELATFPTPHPDRRAFPWPPI
ncbi:MAG TPA: SCO1664 family protein, partial [Actinomycetota bacterium]|nr:SCO1664 family protein [Actinomycetota bacterium]